MPRLNVWSSAALGSAPSGSRELITHTSSSFGAVMLHYVGSLKEVMVAVFIPWKLIKATNEFLFLWRVSCWTCINTPLVHYIQFISMLGSFKWQEQGPMQIALDKRWCKGILKHDLIGGWRIIFFWDYQQGKGHWQQSIIQFEDLGPRVRSNVSENPWCW